MTHWGVAGSHSATELQVCTSVKSLRASLHRSRFAPLHRYWLAEHAGALQVLFATSQRAVVAQTLIVDQPVWSGLHVMSSAPLHCTWPGVHGTSAHPCMVALQCAAVAHVAAAVHPFWSALQRSSMAPSHR